MTTTLPVDWKSTLDEQPDFSSATKVVDQALEEGTREEGLKLLSGLLEEFGGSGFYGGEKGTLEWMDKIHKALCPTDEELEKNGVRPEVLRAYMFHID